MEKIGQAVDGRARLEDNLLLELPPVDLENTGAPVDGQGMKEDGIGDLGKIPLAHLCDDLELIRVWNHRFLPEALFLDAFKNKSLDEIEEKEKSGVIDSDTKMDIQFDSGSG
jgi:hypothetical protein